MTISVIPVSGTREAPLCPPYHRREGDARPTHSREEEEEERGGGGQEEGILMHTLNTTYTHESTYITLTFTIWAFCWRSHSDRAFGRSTSRSSASWRTSAAVRMRCICFNGDKSLKLKFTQKWKFRRNLLNLNADGKSADVSACTTHFWSFTAKTALKHSPNQLN